MSDCSLILESFRQLKLRTAIGFLMKSQVQWVFPRLRVEAEGETYFDGMDFSIPTAITGSLYICRL